ncbi:MAG: helix-turn-helix domain-containing protein [Silvanigrellaceae bacterium]|nr:helix-turn-helix domain-containing protein [Silvanigrellaceae bacterium]
MKLKKMYEHVSHLGEIKTEATFEIIEGIETLSYQEIMRMERMVAYKFYLKASKRDLLTPKEVEGIVYFLGINMNKLAGLLKIDRSTLSNIIRGRAPSKRLCERLLEAVEKELLFPNYYKSRFEKAIDCDLDRDYFELLVRNKVA